MSPLPYTPHHRHTVCRTFLCVPKRPSASSPLCHVSTKRYCTWAPLLHPPLLSFIQPGVSLQQDILNILHFLQLCSRCARLAQSEREREGELEMLSVSQLKKNSHGFTCMCFLFSLHVNSHVCSLPLCSISKVTVGLGYRGSCLKATVWMGLLCPGVCGRGHPSSLILTKPQRHVSLMSSVWAS